MWRPVVSLGMTSVLQRPVDGRSALGRTECRRRPPARATAQAPRRPSGRYRHHAGEIDHRLAVERSSRSGHRGQRRRDADDRSADEEIRAALSGSSRSSAEVGQAGGVGRDGTEEEEPDEEQPEDVARGGYQRPPNGGDLPPPPPRARRCALVPTHAGMAFVLPRSRRARSTQRFPRSCVLTCPPTPQLKLRTSGPSAR